MEEMSFDDILKSLKQWFQGSASRKTRRDERATSSIAFKGFQAPLSGTLRNSGGFDANGTGSVGRIHQGLDLRAGGGSEIKPIAPGTVTKAYNDPKGGNAVVIDHHNGYSSYYAHMGTVNVRVGDKLNYDSIVGTVGATGNAKGFPHLHINVYHNGSLVDPASVIPGVPSYTPYNAKTEKLWLPGHKEIADNFNLQKHLARANQIT